MYRSLGIIFGLLLAVTGYAQRRDAIVLAERLGLCDFNHKGSGYPNTYPCSDCRFYLLPLSGELPMPDLFFIEIQSPSHCGTGGCTGTVFQKQGSQYHELFSMFGRVDAERSRPNDPQPLLVYQHFTDHYNFSGKDFPQQAAIWASYRWSPQQRRFQLKDIVRIEVNGEPIAVGPWRSRILSDWQAASPWLF